jgi:hypothetical protein
MVDYCKHHKDKAFGCSVCIRDVEEAKKTSVTAPKPVTAVESERIIYDQCPAAHDGMRCVFGRGHSVGYHSDGSHRWSEPAGVVRLDDVAVAGNYCDVCGCDEANLTSPVEVCRNCLDGQRHATDVARDGEAEYRRQLQATEQRLVEAESRAALLGTQSAAAEARAAEAEAKVQTLERKAEDVRVEYQKLGARAAILEMSQRTIRVERDGVWLWQGDGSDQPESLACPVVMSADTLRDLLRNQVANADAESRAALLGTMVDEERVMKEGALARAEAAERALGEARLKLDEYERDRDAFQAHFSNEKPATGEG